MREKSGMCGRCDSQIIPQPLPDLKQFVRSSPAAQERCACVWLHHRSADMLNFVPLSLPSEMLPCVHVCVSRPCVGRPVSAFRSHLMRLFSRLACHDNRLFLSAHLFSRPDISSTKATSAPVAGRGACGGGGGALGCSTHAWDAGEHKGDVWKSNSWYEK